MSNMSYCRFENTNRDLADCEEALQDMIDHHSSENQLSDSELRAAKELAKRCLLIVEMLGRVAEVPMEDLDDEDLEDAMEQLNVACDDEEEDD